MLHQKIVNAVVQCVTDTIQRQEDAKVAKDIASQIEVDSLLAHLEGGVDNSVHQPPGRKLLPVGRAAIMIADNVGELHKVSGTSHRAVVQVPEAAPKCNRV